MKQYKFYPVTRGERHGEAGRYLTETLTQRKVFLQGILQSNPAEDGYMKWFPRTIELAHKQLNEIHLLEAVENDEPKNKNRKTRKTRLARIRRKR